MTFELDTQSLERLEQVVMDGYEKARIPCQDAMATAAAFIVQNNFGYEGEDRPKPWPKLGEKYAREFHDGDQTPTLILSGDLKESIVVGMGEPDAAYVTTHNEYASDHQWGIKGRLHARPFFPMDDNGQVTPYTMQKVTQAAQEALDKL